jgi:hypothetical protein
MSCGRDPVSSVVGGGRDGGGGGGSGIGPGGSISTSISARVEAASRRRQVGSSPQDGAGTLQVCVVWLFVSLSGPSASLSLPWETLAPTRLSPTQVAQASRPSPLSRGDAPTRPPRADAELPCRRRRGRVGQAGRWRVCCRQGKCAPNLSRSMAWSEFRGVVALVGKLGCVDGRRGIAGRLMLKLEPV